MTQPTSSDVHLDAALTDISVAYMQDEANFVAGRVFPSVPVSHQTDKFHKFDKNDWFRDDAVTKRADDKESSGSGFGLSNDSYSADVWATHIDIGDQQRANADPAVPLEEASSRLVTQRMLIRKERQWATDYFGTGIWQTDKVAGTDFTAWDDKSSDPEKDIQDGQETLLSNTGLEGNTLVVAYPVHLALKRHPQIKDRFKFTSSESITAEMIARFFEIERYMVSKSVYATNNEGAAEAYTFAVGQNALLCHVADSPGIMVPSAGYNFVWNGLTGANDLGIRINNIDMRPTGRKIDRIEGEFAFDMKVVSSDLGYFFSNATS